MAAHGKVAIVTGAASGIGAALTRDLIEKGWNVALMDVDAAQGQALADQFGDQARFFKCHVDDWDEYAQAFTHVWNTWGRLDLSCLNAGIMERSSIYLLRDRHLAGLPQKPDFSCTDVCFKGVMMGTELSIHFMRKNKTPGGQIVCTSSTIGHYGQPVAPEYCGAKAAVLEFVRACAPVLKIKDNITINVVSPGVVTTPIVPKSMTDEYGDAFLTPVGVIVAAYNMFLDDRSLNGKFAYAAGPDTSYITLVKRPANISGEQSDKMEQCSDNLFKQLHGEFSGLPTDLLV